MVLTVILALVYGTATAVQAIPDPVIYPQPDGSPITLLLKGDECIHWAETTDGYTLLCNAQGAYEYARLDPTGRLSFSGILAHDPSGRSRSEKQWLSKTGKGLFFSYSQIAEMKNTMTRSTATDASLMGGFPGTGTRKLLVILVNFSNTTPSYTQNDFNNYMNQSNFNGTGSFRDYYLEVSYGKLVINTTVTVWVTLPNTHDYYGPDLKWGEFAYDAMVAADNLTGVNFAEFDNNLDGVVDGVAIVHQGQGQEETGNIADIWSHSWDLASAGYSAAQRSFDGVQANAYTTVPEKNATGIGTIGVMCHEFGHNLGIPDFYDTDYTVSGLFTGTGRWDVMAGGSWNGVSGTKPAHHNPWTKGFLGWTNPGIMTSGQEVTLRNAQVYPDVIRYNTAAANEYFLCENRQMTGFDAGLPGHGLLIYHVDGNHLSAHTFTNDINCTSHQGLYPVCASATGNVPATFGTINGTGCPFPGTSCKTSFTDATIPASLSWAGMPTGLPVTNITEYPTVQQVTLCFVSCNSTSSPSSFTAVPVSQNQINLSWTLNPASDPVIVAWNTTAVFGLPEPGTTYAPGSVLPGGGTVIASGSMTSLAHTGLCAGTTYYYKAWSMTGNSYSTGISSFSTTFCGAVSSFPWTEGFENNGSIPMCWSQQQVNNSGLNWIFTAGNGATNPSAAHSGAYNACLKDKTCPDNKNRLITPTLDLTSTFNPALTFWHTQAAWGSDQDVLTVYYRTSANGTWTVLATFATSVATWTQETISLPSPGSTYSIAFEGNAKFGFGICIDDIRVASNCPTPLSVSVSVSTSQNPVSQGISVTHLATALNGGPSPVFQWRVDGINVAGATSNSFTHVPNDDDEITCLLTSNAACAVNNPALSIPVFMTVVAVTENIALTNGMVSGSTCYDALQTIVVAGDSSSFTVEPNAAVALIAGLRIRCLPGTRVLPGGQLNARITTTGEFCPAPGPAPVISDDTRVGATNDVIPVLKVYPNPTPGVVTVELSGTEPQTPFLAELFDVSGSRMTTRVFLSGEKQTLSLAGLPAGYYILKAQTGEHSVATRIVRQ